MGIELSIIAGLCYASSSVNATGADRHPVSEEETALFGLSGEALTEAVTACLGERPDLARLDGLLHSSHEWTPVTTTLVVQSVSVTGVGSMPVSLPLAGTGARLTRTVSHLWSPADGVSPAGPVRYSITFPAGGGALEYAHDWGTGTTESASVDVPPGGTGDELVALGMHLGVRIVYDAHLSGEIAVYYRDGRYWALDVGTVMAAGGLRNGRHFVENLNIRYHASTRVVHAATEGDPGRVAGVGNLALTGA